MPRSVLALVTLLLPLVAQGPPNLARGARASASESQGGLTPELAVDGAADTRWSGIPGHNAGVWFQLDWPAPQGIGCVVLRQFDRYVTGLDVQVEDAGTGTWRTLAHLGQAPRRLPMVVVSSFAPVQTRRLRIGNIANGPSFTEVEVFADPAAIPGEIVLRSDLHGNFCGGVSRSGLAVGGAEVTLQGQSRSGPWQRTARCDGDGQFTAAMPAFLSGMVDVVARSEPAAPALARLQVPAAAVQECLTPLDARALPMELSGPWRCAADPPADFAGAAFDDRDWRLVPVPGHLALAGIQPLSGIAGLRRHFAAPAGAGRLLLRCEGVYSGAEVFLNGVLVAAHEGGATPFEADVTDAVSAGDNVLAVRVAEHTRTSDELDQMSSYADFPLAGIFRPITLRRVPDLHLARLAVTPRFDAALRDATLRDATLAVHATVRNASSRLVEHGVLRAALRDPDGNAVPGAVTEAGFSAAAFGEGIVALTLPVAAPRPWHAESPTLYTLDLELAVGAVVGGTLSQRVGFRQTDVRGTELLIDGRPVKIRGTCHHDAHPLLGRAVTPELQRQDLELIKAANLNALRTSHYPPLPALLDLADELGVFVQDEAPFCWVNSADDPGQMPRILQLTAEMVARDRNHPCVFLWSLCNESAFGVGFERSHAWLRAADQSRPTAAATSRDLDLATWHNPISSARIAEAARLDRPLLFDESFCIFQGIFGDVAELWIDPGVRDLYVEPLRQVFEDFWHSPVVAGSQIWCFADDLFCVPGRGLEYGRGATRCHFVESSYQMPGRGLCGDAPWGFVDGWRRTKPEFWHVRKLHSPVRIAETPLPGAATLRVPVANRYDFRDLSELQVQWRAGNVAGRTRVAAAPHAGGTLVVELPAAPADGTELELRFVETSGREVDAFRIPIGVATELSAPVTGPAAAPLAIVTETTLAGTATRVVGGEFELAFDRGMGRLRRCVAFGAPVLLELPAPHLLAADRALAPLPEPGTWRLGRLDVTRDGADVIATTEGEWDGLAARTTLRIAPDGGLTVTSECRRSGPALWARELGTRLALPRDCNQLEWLRRGPWRVYPDDHIGRTRGAALAFPPVEPVVPPHHAWSLDPSPFGSNDFRSSKRNCVWATLRSAAGPGVLVSASGEQHVRALIADDRALLFVNDWSGGTGAGWQEWESNYGRGRRIEAGATWTTVVRMRLVR